MSRVGLIMLENFKRNVTYLDEYDEKSFIGFWLDYNTWSDIEYWKLEEDLLKIRHLDDISFDDLSDLMRIVQLMFVPNWKDFTVMKEHEQFTLNKDWGKAPNISDRFERFTYVLGFLFKQNREPDLSDFAYIK